MAQRVVFDHHPSLNTAELSDRRSLQWLPSSLSCHRRCAAAPLPELAQRAVAPALLPSQPVPTPLCVHLLRPCHDHHRRRCQREEGGEGISRRQGDTLCEHTRRARHSKNTRVGMCRQALDAVEPSTSAPFRVSLSLVPRTPMPASAKSERRGKDRPRSGQSEHLMAGGLDACQAGG